jgi:hypothetical protein
MTKNAKPIRKLSAAQFTKMATEFLSTNDSKKIAELKPVLLNYVANVNGVFSASDALMKKLGYVQTPSAVIGGKKYAGVFELPNKTLKPIKPLSAKTDRERLRMYAEVNRLFDSSEPNAKIKLATLRTKIRAFERKISSGEIE